MLKHNNSALDNSALAESLKSRISGQVLFNPFDRGRYATDASIYQMMPLGVVVPETLDDIRETLSTARSAGLPVLPRGGGTSQCGQTVNEALVIDNSRHMNKLVSVDVENRTCVVQPGIVLDELNRQLKPYGLWFPVDVSTSSRATIGGMTGNNSCGARSIRYGKMRDNVLKIDAIMPDGSERSFGPIKDHIDLANDPLLQDLLNLGEREAAEIMEKFPSVMRRVGGYNIDALMPSNQEQNMSHLLVGSEGTLAYSTEITLKLSPIVQHKALGVCHFPTFYQCMDSTQHLVKLGPLAVELADRTMIELARDIPIFAPIINKFVRGKPDGVLLVEFAEESQEASIAKLDELEEMMGDLGFSWKGEGKNWGGVVRAEDKTFQKQIWDVRKQGLNIMMSMKQEGKPVSFVEDCAVELPDLADFTAKLTDIFGKYDSKGTWYAHASVGCLHVRPVLNLKQNEDVKAMRAIAEEAFEVVREYKGSHSGEHGDGIVRSEFHKDMFGQRMIDNFEEVKQMFDPEGLMNPNKIVNPPKMDDRSLFRFKPDYKVPEIKTELDWSAWPGAGGGFQGAIEMCNNNGACRKIKDGVMCPSYRVTRNEKDLTRGRANTLRLAISGQLGSDALTSDEMAETMKLCVSCKGCKRECPTGVDMARMKIEVLAARAKKHGVGLHEKLVGYLPRYAPWASKVPWLVNMRNHVSVLAKLMEGPTGFSQKRKLPAWSSTPFKDTKDEGETPDVVVFADTFNRYFEPENLNAAVRVLKAAGKKVATAKPKDGGRPLCCGRTFLSAGLVDEARAEAKRLIEAVLPYAKQGIPSVGLEPSCLLTLRDEMKGLIPGEDTDIIANYALMLEEYIARENKADRMDLPLKPLDEPVLLHGHCHQKAFAVMPDIEHTLRLIPDLELKTVETSCCGMAGSFGYNKETIDTSLKMAELDLLPSVREASDDTLVVADGTSCRHQIADGTEQNAIHVARVLERALDHNQAGE